MKTKTPILSYCTAFIVAMLGNPTSSDAQDIQLEVEAWEPNPDSGWVSCPWVYCWNGSDYVADNDVYSTARTSNREYTDYYTLQKPLVEKNGEYSLELREDGAEHSFTDMVKLIVVDHPSSVRIGSDEAGNIGTYADPSPPVSVSYDGDLDLLEVTEEDSIGALVYHQDYIIFDFGDVGVSEGALFVIRAIGFKVEHDQDWGDKTYQQPKLQIQTLNHQGEWATNNTFYPRDDWATGCYDLTGLLPDSDGHIKVRIFVTSCHTKKYHIIDYIGLETDPQVPVNLKTLLPTSAVHSIGTNVLHWLEASDGVYTETMPGEKISMTFSVPVLSDELRDFVFVSKGYYLPLDKGTFYIYVWNTVLWKAVNSASFVSSDDFSDTTIIFGDMGAYLPDSDGEYKVRISQSYTKDQARIDFVSLTKDGKVGNMFSAWDLGKGWSVLDTISVSDDIWEQFGQWPHDSLNIRTVEIKWNWEPVNILQHPMLIPKEFSLLQNYPNPFNPVTSIEYQLSITSEVELDVYDLLGKKIITLVSERKPPGTYRIEWNAEDLASGIYLYRLRAGNYTETRMMVYQ